MLVSSFQQTFSDVFEPIFFRASDSLATQGATVLIDCITDFLETFATRR